MKRARIGSGSASLVGLGVLALAACARGILDDEGPYPEVRLRIGEDVIVAEVADDPARQRLGLSGRPSLEPGRGLLFPYHPPSRPRFLMRDMHFDIDIVWIRAGRIVGVVHEAPHRVTPPLPRYQPETPIDHVLEVPAGSARAGGWSTGDPVVFEAED